MGYSRARGNLTNEIKTRSKKTRDTFPLKGSLRMGDGLIFLKIFAPHSFSSIKYSI